MRAGGITCERAGGSCASPVTARGFVCVCLCAAPLSRVASGGRGGCKRTIASRPLSRAPANPLNCEERWRRLWGRGCEVAWGGSRRSLALSLELDPAKGKKPKTLARLCLSLPKAVWSQRAGLSFFSFFIFGQTRLGEWVREAEPKKLYFGSSIKYLHCLILLQCG